MLIWELNLKKKFEEKFPEYYEGCKDEKWYFLRSSNLCSVNNSKIGAVCTFEYKDERNFKLSVSTLKGLKEK